MYTESTTFNQEFVFFVGELLLRLRTRPYYNTECIIIMKTRLHFLIFVAIFVDFILIDIAIVVVVVVVMVW